MSSSLRGTIRLNRSLPYSYLYILNALAEASDEIQKALETTEQRNWLLEELDDQIQHVLRQAVVQVPQEDPEQPQHGRARPQPTPR